MLTRIISGGCAAVLAMVIIFFGGTVGLTVTLALIAGLATFELLRAAEFSARDRIPAVAAAMSAPLLLWVSGWAVMMLLTLYVMYVMVESVVRHATLPPDRAAVKVFLPLIAVGGFTALAALRAHGEHGLFYLFLVLVIAWLSDTGAYFTGMFCGKHKLCPVISPKKTVEGFAGGVVISVGACALTGYVYTLLCHGSVTVNWLSLLAVALVGAPLSVFGDLFASVVKRRYGVKDYGKIMPGHGGAMDRFDSVLPVAVLVLLWVYLWPIV